MTKTQSGDIIIHKETWEQLRSDEYYHEILEQLEDLEDHYESKRIGNPKDFKQFVDGIENE